MTETATARYVTADFNSAPLAALASLMGLEHHQRQITNAPAVYTPILNGIAVYRHLSSPQQSEVIRAIRNDLPRGLLTNKLITLVTDQLVQPYWYMWSLSDEELKEFFTFSKNTATVTDQMNPLSLPSITVAGVATGVLMASKNGVRSAVLTHFNILKESSLVKEVAKRLGFENRIVSAAGALSIPTIIVISGLNIMAKKQSDGARRELAARGLLVYSDL